MKLIVDVVMDKTVEVMDYASFLTVSLVVLEKPADLMDVEDSAGAAAAGKSAKGASAFSITATGKNAVTTDAGGSAVPAPQTRHVGTTCVTRIPD